MNNKDTQIAAKKITFYALILFSFASTFQGVYLIVKAYNRIGTYIPKNCSDICTMELPKRYTFEFPIVSLFFFSAAVVLLYWAYLIRRDIKKGARRLL